MEKHAFIIRCSPSYIRRTDEMVKDSQIVIGWSITKDRLFNENLNREDFKQILKDAYPGYIDNSYSLGQGTGYLWRFIREMQIGNYVLVPCPKAFYLGKVCSDPFFLPDKVDEDTAIRRKVEWLNNSEPISRSYCGAGLISRLKFQGTCVGASDLISEIEKALENAQAKKEPSFKEQLAEKLKSDIVEILNSTATYLDDRKFEKLICQLMTGLGAKTSIIPSRKKYRNSIADVDVIANYIHLGLKIYIQVKKHKSESDKRAVEQILEAIKSDGSEGTIPIYGWVVTSSRFDEEAQKLANDCGVRIINNDDLADMILTVGLDKFEL